MYAWQQKPYDPYIELYPCNNNGQFYFELLNFMISSNFKTVNRSFLASSQLTIILS